MSQAQISFTLLALAAVGLVSLAVWIAARGRTTPEKRERRRRLYVNAEGRLGDAFVTEADDRLLYYSYSIRGVQYTASQDISALRDRLPEDLSRLIGPAGMKYVSNNPANSILLCQEWSGLRVPAAAPVSDPPVADPPVDPQAQRTLTL